MHPITTLTLSLTRTVATTTDNDVAGLTIAETGGSTSVAGTGTTDTFTIVLNAQPSSNVVLIVTSSDTGEVTVNTPLTFTSGNWNTAQTVTVTGVDETAIIDGTISSTITIAVDDANSITILTLSLTRLSPPLPLTMTLPAHYR